ncbi:hypothetical protein WMY93_021584 [Mugilogobius chulae]|uniref:DZF domain-containing protein n=1 Tax=Mugilogobius chulae TaxID=88201 RepID=A0AAW0NMC5_9GOBI
MVQPVVSAAVSEADREHLCAEEELIPACSSDGSADSRAHEERTRPEFCFLTQHPPRFSPLVFRPGRPERRKSTPTPAAAMRSFRSFSNDDRHVMAKHSTIYPSSAELEAVQTLVSTVECALKHVSDYLDQSNGEACHQDDSQPAESTEQEGAEPNEEAGQEAEEPGEGYREPGGGGGGVLCGVMRIGLVAKGLLIKGDMELELVLMCRDKPTQTLLDTVCQCLPAQIQKLTEEKYEVTSCVPEAAILVQTTRSQTQSEDHAHLAGHERRPG